MADDDPKESGYLKIDTILNSDPDEKDFAGDPLLLVKMEGTEGISRLFGYNVIMLRDAGGAEGERNAKGEKRPPIDPKKLIGTHVSLGARQDVDEELFLTRVGMFETFRNVLSVDVTHFAVFKIGVNIRDFHIYRARVVPWVKVLSRDICYRIFEGKTVVEIIDAIAAEAKKAFPHILIDTSELTSDGHAFAPMEYCVQFGESTLDFLSRLMARFGIWYYFGYRPSSASLVVNEWMILKGSWDNSAPDTGRDVTIVATDPERDQIGKLVRQYRPPERQVAVGGFNDLAPTHPFYDAEAVTAANDLLKPAEGGDPSQTKWLGSTGFAEPLFSWEDAYASGTAASYSNQSGTITISGVSKNPWFRAAHKFHILEPRGFDRADNLNIPIADLVNTDLIINSFTISVHDYKCINLFGWQFLDIFFSTYSVPGGENQDASDTAFAKVSTWVSNNAQNQVFPATFANPALDPAHPPPPGQLYWSREGSIGDRIANLSWQLLSGLAWVLFQEIDLKKMLADNKDQAAFAVGFIAFSAAPPVDFPLPLAARPVARGPHTAMVIGPDDGKGVQLHGQDIYCDAIGRVRVRFPWDPGPPQGGGKIPPVFPFSHSDKPTTVGGNTCWVRVVEGWAGRHYGTQFLPRIGQEVLVDFLDGDPERPVITGRLYNADGLPTNLPFPDPSVKDTQIKDLTDLPNTARPDLPLSGIKTWSIPTTDGDGKALPTRFHLLRFSDKRNAEQYLIRSQHRLDITAFDKRYESIGSDRHLTVGGKKTDPPPPEIGGDYIGKIFRHYYLHVGDPEFPNSIRQSDHVPRAERGDPGQEGFQSGDRRQLEHQRRRPGDHRRQ